MKKIKKVCVFCGSKDGKDPIYTQAAFEFGSILGKNKIQLIYGAGGTGVMRAVADGCKQAGGTVKGMTTRRLFSIEKSELSGVEDVQVFHHLFNRKVAMTRAADAFVVMPGGLGTLDELFELMTLKYLGIISSPIIIFNINFFFDGLRAFVRQCIRDAFIHVVDKELIVFVDDVKDIMPEIERKYKEAQSKV